ncbi:MAG: cytidine deaminase [Alphaproteobacteria bacterium]|nr:cytidine deaminase [Alphaproteobacteria bacterium]
MSDSALVAAATRVRVHAWAPYSDVQVGAAVLADDGRIFAGVNVENASFSHVCCAERVAVFKAVSEGARRLVACAVVTDHDQPVSPCGACRQVLHEFGPDMRLILATTDGVRRETTLRALLPEPFEARHVLDHRRA